MGGLIGTVSSEKDGLQSKESYTSNNFLIEGTGITSKYIKVASVTKKSGEGANQFFSIILFGGEGYTSPSSVTYISGVIHQSGTPKVAKNNIIGTLSCGYVVTDAGFDCYVKATTYHNKILRTIINSDNADFTVSSQDSEPQGYVEV